MFSTMVNIGQEIRVITNIPFHNLIGVFSIKVFLEHHCSISFYSVSKLNTLNVVLSCFGYAFMESPVNPSWLSRLPISPTATLQVPGFSTIAIVSQAWPISQE